MKKYSILLLAFTAACAVPQTTETKEDSVAVLSEDTLQMTTDEDVMAPVDTVFEDLKLDGQFSEPQIDPAVGYVYNREGLEVFETNAATAVIGHIDAETKVKLLDGLRADYVPIEFDGKTGFVKRDFILNLPVPTTENVIQYFLRTLQLTKPVIERRSQPDAEDGSFLVVNYEFEGGYKIFRHEYYEGGGTDVTLPGYNAAQAFHFASYFFEDFRTNFESMPTEARDEKLADETYVKVEVADGNVQGISVGQGEGCYSEVRIKVEADRVVMSNDGGC